VKRRPVSRRYRTPAEARSTRLSAAEMHARPVGEVRRFLLGRVPLLATQITAGRWMLHGRSVGVHDLAGLPSTVQELRPGADGGWDKDGEQ
jgi:hypothetical protein